MLLRTRSRALPLCRHVGFVSVCSSGLRRFCGVHMTSRGTVTAKTSRDSRRAVRSTTRLMSRVGRRIGHRLRRHVHVCRRGVLPTLQGRRVVFCRDHGMRPFRHSFIHDFFHRRVFPCLTPIPMDGSGIVSFLHSGHLCLTMQLRLGKTPTDSPGHVRCFIVGLPCDGIPHFVRLPGIKGSCCLVFVRSVVGTGLSAVFPNCRISDDCYVGVSHSTSVLVSSTTGASRVVRRIGGGMGGHGVNTIYHFMCSHTVPRSFLSFLMSTCHVSHQRLIPKSGRLGVRSLQRLPGPGRDMHPVGGPRPVGLAYLSRHRSVFHCIRGGSLLLRCPCRSFSRFVRFLCRTIRRPAIHRVVIARCHITRGSAIVGALVTTTRGKGGIAIFIRLGTHFSRRGGLTATRVVGTTNVGVVFDVPKLGMRTGMTLILHHSGRKHGLADCTCVDANGFGRGATALCTSDKLFAYGPIVMGSLRGLFHALRKGRGPIFRHLLITHFGLVPRLGHLVGRRVRLAQRNGRKQVVLGVGTLRSPTVVSHLCRTSRTNMRVSLVIHNVYYLVPKRRCDRGVHIAHVISAFLRRTHI